MTQTLHLHCREQTLIPEQKPHLCHFTGHNVTKPNVRKTVGRGAVMEHFSSRQRNSTVIGPASMNGLIDIWQP